MNQDELKRQAAEKALEFLPDGGVLGIGTGSTVNHFIDLLAPHTGKFDGAVSSSEASTERLKAIGMPVLDLNSTGDLEVYVDGADESNRQLHLIKGGGGALTREKIVAAASMCWGWRIEAARISVSMNPGAMTLTVMSKRPTSRASWMARAAYCRFCTVGQVAVVASSARSKPSLDLP